MMQRRSILSSLLLVSLLSTFAFSSAVAQGNTVSVDSNPSSQRCVAGVLNVSIDISQDISALELILETSGDATVTSVTFDASLASLGLQGDVSVPGLIRIFALDTTGGAGCLPTGIHVAAQIAYLTDDVCSGQFTVSGGTTAPDSNGVTFSTQAVDCAGNPNVAIVPLTVTGGVVTIINSVPTIACPVDTTMQFGQVLTVNAMATDPDEPNGCESLTYSLGPGSPGYASVTQTGAVILAPQGTNVGIGTVEVIVEDKCGVRDSCSFTVCVQNTPPVAICDSVTNRICWGLEASGTVSSTDADSGPFPAQYSVVSFNGPGTVNINPATGDWTWDTQEDASYIGNFQLCVEVTDGANISDPSCSPENADTCCLDIFVLQTTRVAIEFLDPVAQGGPADLAITLEGGYPSYPMAGFDFLIQYDASVLAITGASQGDFLSNNAWEFFTFRFGPNGNCGSGCPSGKFRMVALADLNDGGVTATGFTNTSAGSDELAVMHFQVSGDRTLQGNVVGVNWCWFDCGDNTISSVSGDSLFISRFVYTRDGVFGDGGASSIHGTDQDFPTLTGAPDVCNTSGGPGKPEPIRKVDFKNGGLKIASDGDLDDRGDINLNGLAHEIADAVLFTNYFISGISVFTVPSNTGGVGAGQIQASDVNADGLVLTVADLVYLIRVIVGDALPLGKLAHNSNTAVITTQGPIVSTDIEMGAALFVFNGVADVELLQSGLTIMTGTRDGNTYALVAPGVSEVGGVSSATIIVGEIVTSNATLLSVDASTLDGAVLNIVTEVLPEHFALGQNYPNPFNPSTKIKIDLPFASEYTLTIYNINGQKVHEITGSADAGFVTVEWEASAFASGIYFYKLNTGNFASTKKMLLLK